MAFYEQGLGFTEIAGRVGLSRRTIERWIKEGEFPQAKRRRKRRSIFDLYAAYVLYLLVHRLHIVKPLTREKTWYLTTNILYYIFVAG